MVESSAKRRWCRWFLAGFGLFGRSREAEGLWAFAAEEEEIRRSMCRLEVAEESHDGLDRLRFRLSWSPFLVPVYFQRWALRHLLGCLRQMTILKKSWDSIAALDFSIYPEVMTSHNLGTKEVAELTRATCWANFIFIFKKYLHHATNKRNFFLSKRPIYTICRSLFKKKLPNFHSVGPKIHNLGTNQAHSFKVGTYLVPLPHKVYLILYATLKHFNPNNDSHLMDMRISLCAFTSGFLH